MKKVFALFLVGGLMSLAACQEKKAEGEGADTTVVAADTTVVDTTVATDTVAADTTK